MQNVCFLKWASHFDMEVDWNVLVGFPGEQPDHYAVQLRTMKRIPHLPPPQGFGRIRMDRFSPYFKDPAAWGLTDVRPDRAYEMIYPGDISLDRIAYYFEYAAAGTLSDEHHAALFDHIRWWQAAWHESSRPQLLYSRVGDSLVIRDERQPRDPKRYLFPHPAGELYAACHATARTLESLQQAMRERSIDLALLDIRNLLDEFDAHGLVLEENGRFLSLANPFCQSSN
jgi:hypothetical protein